MSQSAFHMPSINLFGSGTVNAVGPRLADLGVKKVLLVTDDGLFKLGFADKIANIIHEANVEVVMFPKAEPNPKDTNVEEGLEIFKSERCDSIVTLGGGSSHDTGKAIGLVVANGGRIHDYEGFNKSKKPMIRLIAINTTAGTGSEVTQAAVITDTSRKVKMAIADEHVTPTISINDPDLMLGLPPGLTASTGMDALTHAVEAYVSIIANPLTDALAIQAIKIIPKYLPKAVANGQDIEAREQMIFAQSLAGIAFNNAFLGYVHAIAHQFGGFYNFAHGVCNAILLPHVCRFNLIAKEEKFAEIAVALGVNVDGLSKREAAEKGIEKMEQMNRDLNIPSGFAELGAKEEDIEILAQNAMKDVCATTNPRIARIDDVIAIIKAAM